MTDFYDVEQENYLEFLLENAPDALIRNKINRLDDFVDFLRFAAKHDRMELFKIALERIRADAYFYFEKFNFQDSKFG